MGWSALQSEAAGRFDPVSLARQTTNPGLGGCWCEPFAHTYRFVELLKVASQPYPVERAKFRLERIVLSIDFVVIEEPMKTVLLLGRTSAVVDSARDQIRQADVELYTGNNLKDAQRIFGERAIDAVIMGAGLDLADRLRIVEFVFTTSGSTTVHMKDKDSGAEGYLPFVLSVVRGMFGPTAV